jgi:hypothetical protein
MDDRHFGYITKLGKKHLASPGLPSDWARARVGEDLKCRWRMSHVAESTFRLIIHTLALLLPVSDEPRGRKYV